MNANIKAKWVAALRSGTYSQTTGTLKDSGGYCCLGVLCDVVEPQGWSADGWARADDEYHCQNDLTVRFSKSIGLFAPAEARLISMNDEEKQTFAQIADYIEQNL